MLAQVELTDLGVNVGEWVPVVASALGLVILAVLGVFFAHLVLRVGIRWVRSQLVDAPAPRQHDSHVWDDYYARRDRGEV